MFIVSNPTIGLYFPCVSTHKCSLSLRILWTEINNTENKDSRHTPNISRVEIILFASRLFSQNIGLKRGIAIQVFLNSKENDASYNELAITCIRCLILVKIPLNSYPVSVIYVDTIKINKHTQQLRTRAINQVTYKDRDSAKSTANIRDHY